MSRWVVLLVAVSCNVVQGRKKGGSLGQGSEQLDTQETSEKLEAYKKTFAGAGGDALRRHGRSLGCSACQLAATRFQTKVARKIKGKMKESEKKKIFEAGIASVCATSNWPKQMAVVEKQGEEIYVDWMDALQNREGKVSVKRMSPEILTDITEACMQVLQEEFREPLWQKVLTTPKKGRASDTNFASWLCGPGRADICDATEEEESEDGEERDEDQEEL